MSLSGYKRLLGQMGRDGVLLLGADPALARDPARLTAAGLRAAIRRDTRRRHQA